MRNWPINGKLSCLSTALGRGGAQFTQNRRWGDLVCFDGKGDTNHIWKMGFNERPIRALAGMRRPRCVCMHRGLLGPFLGTAFMAGQQAPDLH